MRCSSAVPAIFFIVTLIKSYFSVVKGHSSRELGTDTTRTLSIPHPTVTTPTIVCSKSSFWARIARGGSNNITNAYDSDRQIPSLFQNESDMIYDRYAACLAATEGLRRIRDVTIESQIQQQNDNDKKLRTKKNIREAKEWAVAVYAEKASKVIEAMGMPVSEFNAIGRIVCNDATLKQKVSDLFVVLIDVRTRNSLTLIIVLP
jgi:Domain of unknown function (DUF4168)